MWSDLGAVTGELADDSANVVDLIERKYKVKLKLTNRIQARVHDLKCFSLKGRQAFLSLPHSAIKDEHFILFSCMILRTVTC